MEISICFNSCYVLKGKTKKYLTHEASRVCDVSPDFSVNLDQTLFQDLLHLIISQGILKAIPEENNQWQTLAQLVGTGGWTWCLKERNVTIVRLAIHEVTEVNYMSIHRHTLQDRDSLFFLLKTNKAGTLRVRETLSCMV